MSLITTTPLHTYERYYRRIEPILKERKAAGYLVLILTFTTLAFFGYFAIKPTLATIATLQRDIEDSRFVNERLEEKISNLITAQESYQDITPDLPLVYANIPNAPQFSSLITALENLIAEYNASMSGLTIEPLSLYSSVLPDEKNTASAAAQPVHFNIELDGDYPHIVQFLERLIRINRLITIRSVGMRTGQNSVLIHAKLSLSAYYLP